MPREQAKEPEPETSRPFLPDDASFWMMINSYLKNWWLVNQPVKRGGWTSRDHINSEFDSHVWNYLLQDLFLE